MCQLWALHVVIKRQFFTFIFAVFLQNLFYSRNGQRGRTASLCQISSKLLEPRPKYDDFSIFQDGSRRGLAFLKSQIFPVDF